MKALIWLSGTIWTFVWGYCHGCSTAFGSDELSP